MDELDRLLSRERARWRANLPEGQLLWGFDKWLLDPLEIHHVGGGFFSDLKMPAPVSMHRELTRRSLEEHRPVQLGASRTPAEIEGRVRLHMADILEGLADYLRFSGEPLILAGQRRGNNVKLDPLLGCYGDLFRDVGQLLRDAADRGQFRL